MVTRMYNCYFGDCFRISNDGQKDLLVDCGIHPNSICENKKTKKNRFDFIHSDILGKNTDFLLTHYHEDHYNGIISISKNHNYKFDDVYIPDIWNEQVSIDAVNVVLLEEMLAECYLARNRSLVDFLKAICSSKIHFVKKDDPIQDKYVALWPTIDFINRRAHSLHGDAVENLQLNGIQSELLYSIAGRIKSAVLDMREDNVPVEEILERCRIAENDMTRFVETLNSDNKTYTKNAKKQIKYLSEFGNDISIVFHNKTYEKYENILFTGDFGSDSYLWNEMLYPSGNPESRSLYSNYHIIKVPHHGTKPYFNSIMADIIDQKSIFLIPNSNCKGKLSSATISQNYSLLSLSKEATTICTNTNHCDACSINNNTCSCRRYENVSSRPNNYIDIC